MPINLNGYQQFKTFLLYRKDILRHNKNKNGKDFVMLKLREEDGSILTMLYSPKMMSALKYNMDTEIKQKLIVADTNQAEAFNYLAVKYEMNPTAEYTCTRLFDDGSREEVKLTQDELFEILQIRNDSIRKNLATAREKFVERKGTTEVNG